MGIPSTITREHVLLALADLDAGVEHPFGEPTMYELTHEGRPYPPKAVVGLAARHATGTLLRPDEFSGGEGASHANALLRRLGFTVVKKVGHGSPARTFLLTWNPDRWPWTNLAEKAALLRTGSPVHERWSVGNRTTGISEGDRFFILRQGREPRGIFGAGRIESEVFREAHYDRLRQEEGAEAKYVRILFDSLIDPDAEPESVLHVSVLRQSFPGPNLWRTQASGTELAAEVAARLEELWARHGHVAALPRLPEEVTLPEQFVEGAVRSITVNAYERNDAARRACIEHWGTACSVCGFDFEQVYGDIGAGYVHVHHLVPLADIGHEYQLDPFADLRPVCANCHAMIHRREPPFTPDELRQIIRRD